MTDIRDSFHYAVIAKQKENIYLSISQEKPVKFNYEVYIAFPDKEKLLEWITFNSDLDFRVIQATPMKVTTKIECECEPVTRMGK